MTNIEIHGFECDAVAGIDMRASELRNKILYTLFVGKLYADEMVVTTVADDVRDFHGESQPFLRVISTPCHELDEIVKTLETLHMDIEVMTLTAFHPKK